MARTLNTMPYQVQVAKREKWRSACRSYPQPFGGAWPGRSGYARFRNRQHRARCNQALRNGQEMPVEIHRVAWDVW